jgi:hypothetical protein
MQTREELCELFSFSLEVLVAYKHYVSTCWSVT